MTLGEKKVAALVTRYCDGAAVGMRFAEPHLLDLAYVDRDGQPPRPIRIDFRTGSVCAAPSLAPPGSGELADVDQVAGVAAIVGTGGSIEVYASLSENHGANTRESSEQSGARRGTTAKIASALAPSRLLQRFTRMGKPPKLQLRLSDDGTTLFTSATEVLNCCDIASGNIRKLRCFDRVTHVASSTHLIVAQNKEGVLTIFDATSGARCVTIRIAHDGWLAFDDNGGFERSSGFPRRFELSWTDVRSSAFVPELGIGTFCRNQVPLFDIGPKPCHVTGLLALACVQ